MLPLVSIIIPTLNRKHLISETLDSVLIQTYINWECIIVDDGSSDNIDKIINSYCSKDERVKFFPRPSNMKNGASSCRNYGLKKSKGYYIQFLDSDDILSSEKIAEQVKIMDSDINISLTTCAWGRITNDLNYILFKNLPSYRNFTSMVDYLNSLVNAKGYFPLNAFLFRRDLIEIAGPWNELISLNDDGEFMSRMIINSNKIVFSEDTKVWYRTSNSNNLSNYKTQDAVEKAIFSWMLIEGNLKISFGDEIENFIESSKKNLFFNVIKSYPSLITKHNNFFKNQILEFQRNKSFEQRFLLKIKKCLRF